MNNSANFQDRRLVFFLIRPNFSRRFHLWWWKDCMYGLKWSMATFCSPVALHLTPGCYIHLPNIETCTVFISGYNTWACTLMLVLETCHAHCFLIFRPTYSWHRPMKFAMLTQIGLNIQQKNIQADNCSRNGFMPMLGTCTVFYMIITHTGLCTHCFFMFRPTYICSSSMKFCIQAETGLNIQQEKNQVDSSSESVHFPILGTCTLVYRSNTQGLHTAFSP